MPRYQTIFPLFILFFFLGFGLKGQNYLQTQREVQNQRVQFEKLEWKYLSNGSFEVYFYGNNRILAEKTLNYVVQESKRISKILGYYAYNTVKVFVHDSPYDLIQDNSGVTASSNQELLADNLSKFKIQIAMEGSMKEYQRKLSTDLSELYLNDMLFGGNIRESLQNALLLSVPEWYSKGIVAYLVDGESADMNQYMIRAISQAKLKKLNLAQGEEAKLIGQSIWSYIANLYGNQVISNIINYTRIIRNEQSSFTSALKKPFSEIIQEWYRYYVNKLQFYNNTIEASSEDGLETFQFKFNEILNYQFSLNGKYLAFANLTNSKIQLNLVELNSGKQTVFYQETRNELLNYPSIQEPIIRWGKNNILYVLLKNKSDSWLYTYSIGAKDFKLSSKKNLGDVDIKDFQPSSNNRRFLVKVLRSGQFDIGFYDLNRKRFNPITSSSEEEFEPRFVGEDAVVYIQRDQDSTLNEQENAQLHSVFYWTPLQEDGPIRLFEHIGEIKNLYALDEKNWLFMVHKTNFKNLVIRNIDSTYSEEILGPTSNWGDYQLIQDKLFFSDKDLFDIHFREIPFANFSSIKRIPYQYESINVNEKDEFIGKIIQSNKDTNNIIREDYYSKKTLQRLERLQRKAEEKQEDLDPNANSRVLPYINKFSFNSSSGDFHVDPIRGLGYKMDFLFNDFLENHLFKIGGWSNLNFNTLDLWSEYDYLAQKIDYKFRYDRKNIMQQTEYAGQKIRYNKISFEASRPLNLYNKISFAAIYTNNRAFDIYSLNSPEINWNYLGAKLEYKLENISSRFENEVEGQRLWFWIDGNLGLNNQSGSFAKINLDYRKYLQLNKIVSLRGRLSTAFGIGENIPHTMIGGMDNWLFIKSEPRNNENPLGFQGDVVRPNVFMSSVTSPMRGFNLNKYSGGSHILLNAQINISVRELLGSTNSQTEFMKYLQFVGFMDFGTAWTGMSPFSKYNGFNTNTYGGNNNPFIIKVTDFRNPFLMGIGGGLRTRLLGYYIKYDYGIGIENKEMKTPISYFTIGYDF